MRWGPPVAGSGSGAMVTITSLPNANSWGWGTPAGSSRCCPEPRDFSMCRPADLPT